MTAADVAKRLRVDLGWSSWALVDVLDGAVREKRFWLKNFSYEPNTHGQTMQENTTSWCERAEALIVQLQEPEQAGEGDG